MAIPPFPSHDLAKLVLGYLAEEQLMTAYDEFLAASPYLDAFTNEFDRIFMTSLKNILAEYRAVKIFVESCKPFLLRKKLIQFSNLLEVVKFLVNNIDVNRFLPQQPAVAKSSSKHFSSRCDVCNSLGMCLCKRVQTSVPCQPAQVEKSLETSIETTSLSDLPGSTVTNQKNILTETIARHSTEGQVNINIRNPNPSNNSSCEQYPLITPEENSHSNLINHDEPMVKTDASPLKSDTTVSVCCNYNTGICNTSSFQEFATGVNRSCNNEKPTVPDSSASEIFNAMNLTTKDNDDINPVINIKGQTNSKHLLKLPIQSNESMLSNLSPRTNFKGDQKITIISDVKVDAYKNKFAKMPPLHPITSTPLLQMQKIVINGTPAYDTNTGVNHRYNKDEIMAMPTIILVPSSGASKNHTPRIVSSRHSKASVNTNSSSSFPSNILGPLVIEVPKQPIPEESNEKIEVATQEPKIVPPETSLLKTIDLTHNSLPKDTNATQKSSTPNILPPTRKSSSTPRRTSHVRVLDFTTPRRILHETINEQDPIIQTDEVIDVDIEMPVMEKNKIKVSGKELELKVSLPLKENYVKRVKKNWDSELRALAVRSDEPIEIKPTLKPKKIKSQKRKSTNIADTKVKTERERESSKKLSPKAKKTKKRTKSTEVVEQLTDEVVNVKDSNEELTVISIIEESDGLTEANKVVDNENINNSDERIDTPDQERLSLQNAICAKLNISDLLETPYKQALYDIQMETPKFLGPDLPDEPISDIKIMNIPTPRFFDTPKLQATPSSYSSRPTDYSSGGSYYKPDDQDFVPEAIKCTTVLEQQTKKENLEEKVESKEKVEIKETIEKPSRPQRKCTRNVSYKRTTSPSSSGTSTASLRKKKEKAIDIKNRSKSKISIVKKKHIPPKSPFKKETPKQYIKIKPFRTSPIKSSSKSKKKSEEILKTLSSKSLSRKRTSSIEKNVSLTPVVTVPTKSRRKSSTPRKLNCTNTCKDNDVNTSNNVVKKEQDITKDANTCIGTEDSDIELQPLRWSDDGSQDDKPKLETTINDTDEDINKIKQFIETTVPNVSNSDGSLHNDLIKRGFDVETARSIERDLLDAIPIQQAMVQSSDGNVNKTEHQNSSEKIESDNSNNLQIVQDEEDDIEEIELSVHDCNDESQNFITCQFYESEFKHKTDTTKLKDKFCMEVCIEDGVSVRLRSTNYVKLLEECPDDYNPKETEAAVSSISDIDKLYTPLKNRKACYEIFDSTLTSIDTPLKSEDKEVSETVTEIVLEEENVDVKDKVELKKRKRVTSEIADESLSKKTKTNEYIFNTTNIQNLDIESLLSKLHGP